MRREAAALLGVLAMLPAPGIAFPRAGVPVRVGGDAADACGTVARVGRRGSLAVRSGPGLRFAARDRLAMGRSLRICEERGLWLGVVYGTSAEACGVATARRLRGPYAGPCRQGWVYRRYVEPLAG